MDSSSSRDADLPHVGTAVPNAQRQDVAEGRRELAQLIGRLLAHNWLQEQRASRQGQTAETASAK
jgi:hypothetical protein